jgi:hypothetical protein
VLNRHEAELGELTGNLAIACGGSSNDYRALNDWLKNSEAEQISAKPKVMTRPVIRDGDTLYLGWDEATKCVAGGLISQIAGHVAMAAPQAVSAVSKSTTCANHR